MRQMVIKHLGIQNFKSLSQCRIDGLGRINLFVGRNNIGKSSVLEAISLLLANGTPSQLRKLLHNRGIECNFSNMEKDDRALFMQQSIASLYAGRDPLKFSKIPMLISARHIDNSTESILLQLGWFSYEDLKKESGETVSQRLFFTGDQIESLDDLSEPDPGLQVEINSRDWRFYRLADLASPSVNSGEKIQKFEFVRPTSTFSSDNAKLFDRIAMTDMHKWLVKALNIIDPRIRDINFLNDPMAARQLSFRQPRVPIVVLDGDNTRYPLSSMGDGVNRLLTIALSMLNCNGGTLLVDEIENGLHYTTLRQLWKMISELASELDIQVFATTHSSDCIKGFIDAGISADGAIVRLENQYDEIVGVPYSEPDELDYISNNNVEIR